MESESRQVISQGESIAKAKALAEAQEIFS